MGLWTTLLALGSLNAFGLAVLIWRQKGSRTANRLLAILLALVALRLWIYVLGFGGAYDAVPWLTFFPLDASAAFAPLFWLYGRAISGRLPRRWRWHLLPAGLQIAYQGLAFTLPLSDKWTWYTTGHLHIVAPIAVVGITAAAAVYLAAAWRDQVGYRAWLDTRFANRERWRLTWLRTMIVAFGLVLAAVALTTGWSLFVAPLSYMQRAPLMLAFCGLGYLLGLLGWRYGGMDYPVWNPEASGPERVDYVRLAAEWTQRIEDAGWWREEGLTLGEVAARLAVSERSLSRALNDGAGRSFNATINAMRVAAIQRALSHPDETRELLTLALDHGFASKASFNRAFREATGRTPSAWRLTIRQSNAKADSEATA